MPRSSSDDESSSGSSSEEEQQVINNVPEVWVLFEIACIATPTAVKTVNFLTHNFLRSLLLVA